VAKATASRRSTPAGRPVEQRDVVLLIADAADPSLASSLCGSARAILEGGAPVLLVCDVHTIPDPDLIALDALARLTLLARQLGGDVLLLDAAPKLEELLELAGLSGVIPCAAPSGGDPRR
jgi:hypothetical protein